MKIRKIFSQEIKDTPTDKKRQSTFTPRYVHWLENRIESLESDNQKLQIDKEPCIWCPTLKGKAVEYYKYCHVCGEALND